jgi:hypothetical protein
MAQTVLPIGLGSLHMAVSWTDEIDGILGGDPTAALAYLTPAGGSVVAAVAPIGLRDRGAGTVTFTTSLGFRRKLDRLKQEPRIALAYHARDHGFSDSPRFVLVQGRASYDEEVDDAFLRDIVGPASERFMGPPKEGRFWDWLLREYYATRIGVHVDVERILVWPDLACRGAPDVLGAPRPEVPPEPQDPPKKGTAPRVDVTKVARRMERLPHRLVAWRDADGYPMVVPFELAGTGADGLHLEVPAGLPPGGRRAGLVAHDYKPKLVGLNTRQQTGWLEDGLYAPQTDAGFRAPANKTLLLIVNGLMAKRGVRQARKAGEA